MGGKRGRLTPEDERCQALELINGACKGGARKFKACELLSVSSRTVERWKKSKGNMDKRSFVLNRSLPSNSLTEAEKTLVLETANNAEYRDYPPSKIVPMLADSGKYIASESTFYRILREEKQLNHRGLTKRREHTKPEQYVALAPNQVWSWDISYLPSNVRGLFFYLYMIIDVYSRKIVGWSIHEIQASEHAADLIKQACIDEGIKQNQVVLHSDNGKPMKGLMMLAMLQLLGVAASFSRPSVSDDNPYSESLFRTVKYHPSYPAESCFRSIYESRKWGEGFVSWYNTEHLHSGIKFVTPISRHNMDDEDILSKRDALYKLAKLKNPNRWSGETRNWDMIKSVALNPTEEKKLRKRQYNDDSGLAQRLS